MSVFSFTMSGQRFDFDMDENLFTGDQTEIVRARTGLPAVQWARRIVGFDVDHVDERDYLLMAYLARYRTNPLLDWHAFIATVAPLTFRPVAADDGPAVSAEKPAAAPKPRAPRSRKAPAATS